MTRTATNNAFEVATGYAKRGWAVFPVHSLDRGRCTCKNSDCSSPCKHPMTVDGLHSATKDLERIRVLFHPELREANIGIATGPVSGIVVLDIDDPNEFVRMTDEHGVLPPTLMARTGGGGIHLLYKHRDGVRNKARVWPGIDIRGEGGYIVAPPSIHISGTRYEWVDAEQEIAPWPDVLVELAEKHRPRRPLAPLAPNPGTSTPYGLKAIETEIPTLKAATVGERNSTLNEVGFCLYQLVAGGELDENLVTNELTFTARGIGLSDREIQGTLRSARDGGFANPRSAPTTPPTKPTKPTKPLDEGSSVGSVGGGTYWEKPLPLSQLPELEPFPTRSLPHFAADYVEAVSENTQTPPDLAGCVSLAVLATLYGGRLRVQINPSWFEPVNVWTAVVLPPGEGKSPVFRRLTDPLHELEQELFEAALPAITEAVTKKKVAEIAADQAKVAAGKAEHEGKDEKLDDAIAAARDAEEIVIPPRPRLQADDATPEAVQSLLANSKHEAIAILSSEGDIFDIMAGRYSNGASNLGIFLKSHSGDRFTRDRVKSGETSLIKRPALTVGLTVQPEVLKSLASRPEMRNKGIVPRFLWSWPVSNLGGRISRRPSIPYALIEKYDSTIKRLGRAAYDQPEARVLTFSSAGEDRLLALMDDIETQLGEGGSLEFMRDWANKMAGATARLAALVHAAEEQSGDINSDTVDRAIRLAHYFLNHTRKTFLEMDRDPVLSKAHTILRWIQRHKRKAFSQREVHQSLNGTFRRVTDLDEPLRLLVNHDYLRRIEVEQKPVGRKPSPQFEVNPELLSPPTEPTESVEAASE